MTADDTEIRLPASLVEQCESRIEGTEFESVEEYARFVLRAVVEPDDGRESPSRADGDAREDDVSADVEDRLASLGYK